jgi:hypothetical protein
MLFIQTLPSHIRTTGFHLTAELAVIENVSNNNEIMYFIAVFIKKIEPFGPIAGYEIPALLYRCRRFI